VLQKGSNEDAHTAEESLHAIQDHIDKSNRHITNIRVQREELNIRVQREREVLTSAVTPATLARGGQGGGGGGGAQTCYELRRLQWFDTQVFALNPKP